MRKISHKLTLGMLLLTLLAVGMLWIYQTTFLERSYLRTRETILKETTEEFVEVYGQDTAQFREKAEMALATGNIITEVTTIEGRVLYTSSQMMGRGHSAGFRIVRGDYLKSLLETGEAKTTTSFQRQSPELFTYSRLLEDGRTVITTSLPVEPINETIELLQSQLLSISFVLVLASLLMGVFFSRFFLQPIKKLNESVNKLASGDMEARVYVKNKDEIGELGHNFNKMAGELGKLDKLRKDLVANVSHELRTPLGLIKGYAEMSRDIHRDNPQKRMENLDIIIEESDRLSTMVNEILDMSKIQSGNMDLWNEEVDLLELAESAASKHMISADEKRLDLSINPKSENYRVWVDRRRIEQVLHNLISNAIDHTHPGGEVEVSLTEEGDFLKIEVRDNGEGIPKDQLDHIWERYYKVSGDRGEKRGTGLGLSITRSIFQAHGLDYGVDSVLGKGSNFYFRVLLIK